MKTDGAEIAAWFMALLGGALIMGGMIGYVANLVAIAHYEGLTGMMILRICGVFIAPLGAILGWM